MTTASWRPLRGIDPASLRAARIQAHLATQWLARTARAYVAVRPEDGHTNLGWEDALGGLVTHPLPDGARFGLEQLESLQPVARKPDLRALEFEDALVDVEGPPVRAAAVGAGRLELDHVRTEVGKVTRAQRGGHCLLQRHDPHT